MFSLAWESDQELDLTWAEWLEGSVGVGPAGCGVECAITIMYIEKAHCIDVTNEWIRPISDQDFFSLEKATLPKFTKVSKWGGRVGGRFKTLQQHH